MGLFRAVKFIYALTIEILLCPTPHIAVKEIKKYGFMASTYGEA